MLRITTILILFAALVNSAKDPPKIIGSYMAQAELVESLAKYGNQIMQLFFEENYDQKENKMSFILWEGGENVTFFQDLTNQQTLQYYENECSVYTFDDWVSSDAVDIRPYESKNYVTFPLKQLLKLDKLTLIEDEPTNTVYRDSAATLWKHRLNYKVQNKTVTLYVDAYWTENRLSPTGNMVPLAYYLNITEKDGDLTIIRNQTVNIYYFVPDTVDQKAFKIPQGISCIGLKRSLPFPQELGNINVFSFNMEFILPQYQTFFTTDIWWDIKNRLVRIDQTPVEPTHLHEGESYTKVISYKQGAVYTIWKISRKCEVTPLEKYLFRPHSLIEPEDNAMWNIGNFFGLDGTSMIYIGDTEKRGIPCSVWQGERIDWPSFARPITTLWEWCIANAKGKKLNLEKDEIPIINLEINVLESSQPKYSDFFTKGEKFIYNFYNMKQHTVASLDTLAFDISPCFVGNRLKLQFLATFDKTSRETLNNATNDVNFLSLWKSTINHKIGLNFTSLRITHLRTFIQADKMVVMFTLLGVHPELKKEVKSTELSLQAAKSALESVINGGNLIIEWLAGKKIIFKAVPNSLTEGFTIPTTTTSTTTGGGITESKTIRESTEPGKFTKWTNNPSSTRSTRSTSSTNENTAKEQSTTENPTDIPSKLKQNKEIRHSPGIMALVSILMLFTGSGIGAAGTYFKFKGLPFKIPFIK
ncbi:uncharacterized protein LOC111629994 isoform X1 [Centruroides sculpturatus]|uniref:uncharacterized protein LOC111629994 isoform X1 n=1 Tax=Centruroides sculpturatus TaxID=218467 RepID=UPI000C6DABB3|nr:uncharacterized protein LOC111629994 isoform X1 [Centruroides sculpturatus]